MNITCPYCQQPAKYMASSEAVYHGRDYGPLWACLKCEAWVGCHPGTKKPLGRLANAELRKAKMAAHAAFDPIWKARYATKSPADPKYKKGMARGGRYKKLAELMGLTRDECHIGEMNVEQCLKVVELCQSGALE